MNLWSRLFPPLSWPLNRKVLRADLLAGATVALILIPQSMAYAQLAGLPAYYGLYAAFLPPIVAALWGSSKYLSTGPVAITSLITASTLATFASSGSETYIALAILIALLAGIFQLALGVFRLGLIVNLLSHPVIVGFTNAAAIIIALSQLNLLLGITIGRSDHFLLDLWGMMQNIGQIHGPTLAMGLGTVAVLLAMRRFAPHLPGVLVAVVIATLVSFVFAYEQNRTIETTRVASTGPALELEALNQARVRAALLDTQIGERSNELVHLQQKDSSRNPRAVELNYQLGLMRLERNETEVQIRDLKTSLEPLRFARSIEGGQERYFLESEAPAEKADSRSWRINTAKVAQGRVEMVGGGAVVGAVPRGLPPLSLPTWDWVMVRELFPGAVIIALVGFMEAISSAKALAARSKDRIDPNKELIGQGLAKIAGSFSASYPTSGSFSRSIVNFNAGAKTGMSSVFTSLLVGITLLFLTPLLYYLPQATLAAIIVVAVLVGLLNFAAMRQAWAVHPHDGIASAITFVGTLAFAPRLDRGIAIGVMLTVLFYLLRSMRPRIASLGRHQDGTLRDAQLHHLITSERIAALRFDAPLIFANVPFFEEALLGTIANNRKIKYVLIVGDGINEIDASGVEALRELYRRLKTTGVQMVFAQFKSQIIQIMRKTDLCESIGKENVFHTADEALDAIYKELGVDESSEGTFCLLRNAPLKEKSVPPTSPGADAASS